MSEAEVERVRRIAVENRDKRGALGVWSRRWLELYDFAVAKIVEAEDKKNALLNGVQVDG